MLNAAEKATKAAGQAVTNRLGRGEGVSTLQRLLKSGEAMDIGEGHDDEGRPITFQRIMDWPLQVLFAKGSLGKRDEGKARYGAGKRFYEHWYLSGVAPSLRGVDPNSLGGGSSGNGPWPASERAYAHRQMFRAAQAALGGDRISTLTALIILNEVDLIAAGKSVYKREDTEQVRALAIEGLKDGLDRLVKHWE